MNAKETALNLATLTYSQTKEIGHEAADAWRAMLAMYGLIDPRIIAGYDSLAVAPVGFFA
jgi:hypothetical protein